MTEKWAALLHAFLAGDRQELQNHAGQGPLGPTRLTAKAFGMHLRAMWQQADWAEVQSATRAALDRAPRWEVARRMLEANLAHAEMRLGHLDRAEELLGDLQARPDCHDTPELQAYLWLMRAQWESMHEERIGALQAVEQALAQPIEEPSAFWYRLCTSRIACLLSSGQTQQAREALDALRPYQQDYDACCAQPVAALQLRLALQDDQPEQGLAALAELKSRPTAMPPLRVLRAEMGLLIRSGRYDRVERILQEHAGQEFSPREELNYRALLAIAQNNGPVAERFALEALDAPGPPNPLMKNHSQLLHLAAVLLQRNAGKARRLLEGLDRLDDRPEVTMEWVRLAVLEEDWGTAERRFRETAERLGFRGVVRELRYAHELTAYALGRLWLATGTMHDSDPCPEQGGTARRSNGTSARSASGRYPSSLSSPTVGSSHGVCVPNNTEERRRALVEYFRRYKKLTRKRAMELLDCAPGTARRDLQHLQKQGLIRRVRTSGHLRTSYWVLVDEDKDHAGSAPPD